MNAKTRRSDSSDITVFIFFKKCIYLKLLYYNEAINLYLIILTDFAGTWRLQEHM